MNKDTKSLEEKIKAIKRKATDRFHNDHADGDLAIYDLIEEMTALVHQENTKARIDENRICQEIVFEEPSMAVQMRKLQTRNATLQALEAEETN